MSPFSKGLFLHLFIMKPFLLLDGISGGDSPKWDLRFVIPDANNEF